MRRRFDFLGKAKYLVPLSLILIAASVVLVIPGVRGLNMGIDFTGGTEFTVRFASRVSVSEIRDVLGTVQAGTLDLRTSKIQSAGPNTYTITMQLTGDQGGQETIDNVQAALKARFPQAEVSRELIGEQISRELTQKGLLAILLAIVAMLIYISWRFRLRYAVACVLELLHDVLISLGIFALFRLEFNLETIAAFLTIIGYSLNDTIVVFDRVRENLKLDQKRSLFDTINLSINQTLVRTLITATGTLAAVVVLLFLGGPVLRGFSVAMLAGILLGTYSSWYIGTVALHGWSRMADKGKARERA